MEENCLDNQSIKDEESSNLNEDELENKLAIKENIELNNKEKSPSKSRDKSKSPVQDSKKLFFIVFTYLFIKKKIRE